jgi:hypothetical protein
MHFVILKNHVPTRQLDQEFAFVTSHMSLKFVWGDSSQSEFACPLKKSPSNPNNKKILLAAVTRLLMTSETKLSPASYLLAMACRLPPLQEIAQWCSLLVSVFFRISL